MELLVAAQYVEGLAVSLNCEPPTATLNGVEARPLTAAPLPVVSLPPLQPAAPLSPEETKAVMPCVAACDQRLL